MRNFEKKRQRSSQWRHMTIKASHFTLTISSHYSDVIMGAMASQITSLTIVYSTVIEGQIKENIKALYHWPLCGNSPVTGEFPAQMASNPENASIWWRHNDKFSMSWHEDGFHCVNTRGSHLLSFISNYTFALPKIISLPTLWCKASVSLSKFIDRRVKMSVPTERHLQS